ncbi:MAG: hypothetical protein QXV62_00680 [Nitrososphaerota archaeon]
MAETALQYIWERYAEFFGFPGDGMGFERVLGVVDNAVNTALSNDVGVIARLMTLSDAERAVEAFTDFHRRYIPATVVNNLAEDLRWILQKARETATILWLEEQRK